MRTTLSALLLTVLALAGCGGEDASPAADRAGGSSSGSGGGDAPDPCTLITDEQLTDLIGTAPEGELTPAGDFTGASCLWMDDDADQGIELSYSPEGLPVENEVREVQGVLFFPFGERELSLNFIDFKDAGLDDDGRPEHLDELRPIVESIQARA